MGRHNTSSPGGPRPSAEPPHPNRRSPGPGPGQPDNAVERVAPREAAAWQTQPEPPPSGGKAGRNLPLAIAVGLVLGAVVLASLLVYRQAFAGVIVVAVGIGVWELGQAMRSKDIAVPTWTLIGCGVGMLGLTWFGGPDMLALGMGLTVMVLVVWRLADGATGYHVDLPASVLVATYVPFLGGFAVLMLQPDDGHLRIIVTLATVVLSDTGGYIAGVLIGRHPMAPRISPKKSWEGMAGSLLACAIGGAIMLQLMFGVEWWKGAVFGATIAIAATLGDLTESLIKRDLGIKDMSRLIPGHGGLMDRLDSILLALPVAFAWLAYLAPVTS
ncbi:MAG TPA: phosphatidate cytidylyltransferase [Stackebrandtia sp.]|jgi:phosphatidate cytidylyltransferase|uniref:phosphatidate cytidylyltransferase n=1 Tax=Stackebrandtia sp. TaxID=2023065 RepID=UPI002D681CBC|nr:phosphatidate cytidylyltransferase [Stackebrandtia sp.]HZE39265.1 phosphatidate cytidylyltransferase [Stackebrandtia sp.]